MCQRENSYTTYQPILRSLLKWKHTSVFAFPPSLALFSALAGRFPTSAVSDTCWFTARLALPTKEWSYTCSCGSRWTQALFPESTACCLNLTSYSRHVGSSYSWWARNICNLLPRCGHVDGEAHHPGPNIFHGLSLCLCYLQIRQNHVSSRTQFWIQDLLPLGWSQVSREHKLECLNPFHQPLTEGGNTFPLTHIISLVADESL